MYTFDDLFVVYDDDIHHQPLDLCSATIAAAGPRMSMRRFTRLTNGFSKKLDNLKAAVSLYFAHCNMVRIHKTLRVIPAVAAGVSDRLWTLTELVEQTSK